MMVVEVETGAAFRFSKPEVLLEERLSTGFPHNPNTVPPDGQRFVMVQEGAPPHFEIVLNWTTALRDSR